MNISTPHVMFLPSEWRYQSISAKTTRWYLLSWSSHTKSTTAFLCLQSAIRCFSITTHHTGFLYSRFFFYSLDSVEASGCWPLIGLVAGNKWQCHHTAFSELSVCSLTCSPHVPVDCLWDFWLPHILQKCAIVQDEAVEDEWMNTFCLISVDCPVVYFLITTLLVHHCPEELVLLKMQHQSHDFLILLLIQLLKQSDGACLINISAAI